MSWVSVSEASVVADELLDLVALALVLGRPADPLGIGPSGTDPCQQGPVKMMCLVWGQGLGLGRELLGGQLVLGHSLKIRDRCFNISITFS